MKINRFNELLKCVNFFCFIKFGLSDVVWSWETCVVRKWVMTFCLERLYPYKPNKSGCIKSDAAVRSSPFSFRWGRVGKLIQSGDVNYAIIHDRCTLTQGTALKDGLTSFKNSSSWDIYFRHPSMPNPHFLLSTACCMIYFNNMTPYIRKGLKFYFS